MLDAVVSFAVNKLGDALIGEADFLFGIRSQVQKLHDELKRMQCFLQDADAKEQQGDSRVRNWVEDIRNLAHDAEDVIDTFILKVETNFLPKIVSRRKVGKEIQAIQARLKAISASRITYGIKDLHGNEASSSETSQRMIQHPLRNRYPHEEDFHVIGFEEHTKILLAELMKDGEERRRCIISIVGVGGLGKTTLAKKIYRHDTVKSRFDCCGWSSISQQLNVKDVLGEIMKCMSLKEGDSQMNEEHRMEKLYNYLQDKRYFVVLDDVWKINHWSTLSHAFPIGRRGSKVLLTTRNKDVALHADPYSLHFEPRYLNDEESWELLCKKAFPMAGANCNPAPEGLEKLGREMARKCGGLPLAICVLGGLLATKRSEIKQWELVHRNVVSYINRGEDGGVNAILALSYHDLPSHLKPCFLYLGVFPEDYEIPRRKLIQLWIAEGFISDKEEDLLTLEDIGKHKYLAELNQRCMIQIDKGDFGGRINICRVHDLMRDLCLSKAKEINFLNTYDMQHRTGDIWWTTDALKKVRRYAAHLTHADPSKRYNINFDIPNCALRTFIVFCPYVAGVGFPLSPIKYQYIKLLRVLDFKTVGEYSSGSITEEVSRLIHLKYLVLGDLSEVSISSSIGNLRNLQMLRLGVYRGNLPETTSKLVQLRHLELFNGSVDRKFRFENLINLHTLEGIRAGKWIRKGCFEKLSNLRRLSVKSANLLQIKIILDELAGKRSSPSSLSSSSSRSDDQHQNPIRSLSLSSFIGGSFPNSIFDSLSCCHNLRSLHLEGRLDIANLQKYPPNLTKLHLFSSVFTEDPMATLQHLPKLCILELQWCKYEGEEMVCSSKGFPQLQFLNINDSEVGMLHLKEWRVDQGGMPRLKELYLWSLKLLPEGLQFITTLETLKMSEMPWMKERVAEGVGEDWYKVQHIPTITIKEGF